MRHILIALTFVLSALPATAQTTYDARWEAWLGCWELVAQNVRDTYDPGDPPAAATPDTAEQPRVCVTPSPGGATFTTTIQGKQLLEQTIVADGVERPVDESECRGAQRAEWSADNVRVYANARLTCSSDTTPRHVSGVTLLARDGAWLDIQAVNVGGTENVRVRRYRRAASPPAGTPPGVAASRLSLGDVKEASGKISERALEAALVETRAAFDLDSRTLLDLDAAGVAGRVIDVIVALSYPEKFVVERTRDRRAAATFINDPFFLDYGFFSPTYDVFYEPYYYSPFAYSYYGRYYNPGFFGPTFIIIDGDGGAPGPRPSGTARAIDGVGYTRVRPRGTDPSAGAHSTQSAARTSVAATGTSSSSSSGSSSSSSSGAGASSSGFSSGSTSTDTGRTAVPR